MAQAAIEVVFDKRQLAQIERAVKGIPRGMPRVVSRAINKTATTARSHLVKRIAGILPIKQKDIRKGMPIYKATLNRWQATIRIIGKAIPLIQFKARQTRKGVTYKKAGADTRALIRSAFIAVMPTGRKGVFLRLGRPRLPIRELYGPSLPSIFENTPGLETETERDIGDLLQHYTQQQIKYLVEKYR